MNIYKVASEDGIELDGVLFEQGELLELDPESKEEVQGFINDGSLVLEKEGPVEPTEEEKANLEAEKKAEAEKQAAEEAERIKQEAKENEEKEKEGAIYFNGKRIVGEVTSEDLEGKTYRSFAVESGETYKVTAAEFADATAGQDTGI